jgi:MoxR-like ATPase
MRYRGDGMTAAGEATGTRGERGRYLADPTLVTAVNTALAVEQPLLVTGDAGTGKTMLAWSIAAELELGPVLAFHTRSDHQARDTLYNIDHLLRFYHAQVRDPRAEAMDNYLQWRALGEAIRSSQQRVVLVDEVDKAPRDFPNDLLDEIDRMEFSVPELGGETFTAAVRPVVVFTSNSERQLPDPFLRRCVFHRIEFPDGARLRTILQERLGHLELAGRLIEAATAKFEQIRALPGLDKKPATAELIAWVRVLHLSGIDPEALAGLPPAAVPFQGTLAKTEQDMTVLKQAR